MRYETFTTAADAAARVDYLRGKGLRCYALALRADCHQVRVWS